MIPAKEKFKVNRNLAYDFQSEDLAKVQLSRYLTNISRIQVNNLGKMPVLNHKLRPKSRHMNTKVFIDKNPSKGKLNY